MAKKRPDRTKSKKRATPHKRKRKPHKRAIVDKQKRTRQKPKPHTKRGARTPAKARTPKRAVPAKPQKSKRSRAAKKGHTTRKRRAAVRRAAGIKSWETRRRRQRAARKAASKRVLRPEKPQRQKPPRKRPLPPAKLDKLLRSRDWRLLALEANREPDSINRLLLRRRSLELNAAQGAEEADLEAIRFIDADDLLRRNGKPAVEPCWLRHMPEAGDWLKRLRKARTRGDERLREEVGKISKETGATLREVYTLVMSP